MSSIKRRARTPVGGPPYYASSAFTTSVTSPPPERSLRSRPTLHQGSFDFTRGRNPALSRRFRDGGWGSTECLVRPSTSALSSTANYVLSSLGGDYHRGRSPARTSALPTRRFGRESSPSPMSSYYKSTCVSTWYDEYKPILRERPAITEKHRPARGSKERRESMGIITRHRHVVKFREDPSFHESSPVVSRARQDSSGHSTRSVDSGIGSFKESGQSPVDLDDVLRLDSPPAAIQEIKLDDSAFSKEVNAVNSAITESVADARRRRRVKNRDILEERQNSATSTVPQEPATLARSNQRVRNQTDGAVPPTPAKKPVMDREKTPTIELPAVRDIYETVVVKLKKGKGRAALGDVSAASAQVENVVHSLPTPNGHCSPTPDSSLDSRSREISPAVVTLELAPKKDNALSKPPTQDNKVPTATTAGQPPGVKKGQKANKVFASLAHLKTGKKTEQDQVVVKKEVKTEPASPEVQSSQPPTPEPRKKHKLFSKTQQSQPKLRDEEETKSKLQATKPQAAETSTDTTPRTSKFEAKSKPEVKPEAVTNAASPHLKDKLPSLLPAPQQKSMPETIATGKVAIQDSLQTAPKESLNSATRRAETTSHQGSAHESDNAGVATASGKTAQGMLEFRRKEPLGRLEFKCKEPQGRLELKKARPIPLGAPPKAVVSAKPKEAEPPKSAQESLPTPEITAKKDAAAASLLTHKPLSTPPKADVPPLPEKMGPSTMPDKPRSLAIKPLVTTLPPQTGSTESKVNKLLKKVRRSRDSESDHSVPGSPSCPTAPSQPASPQVETPTALVAGTPPSPVTPDAPGSQPPTKTARKVNKVKKASKIKVPGASSSGSSSSSSTGGTGDTQRAKKVSKERALPRAKDSSKAPCSPTVDSTPPPTAIFEVNGAITEPSQTTGVDPTPVYLEPKPREDGAVTETSCECKVNCHKKCEKHMANLCGVNQKLLSEVLATVKKEMATSPPGSTTPGGKQARTTSEDAVSPQAPTTTATHPPSPRRSSTIADLAEVKRDAERAQLQWQQDQRQDEDKGEQQDSRPPLPESRSAPQTPTQEERVRFRKYNLTDFHLLKVLGKGSFGKVLLAELKGTRRHYAVKCLKKDVVLEDDDVECTLIERRVLALGTQHPFLCKLFCTFQSQSHLFFVMEFLNGGDLMFHIQQSGRFDQDRARFYAAEIVCALKFLHKKGIVYRDLKLDNLCIDSEGHLRIIDFGMCKLKVYRAQPRAFCGTPEYMAPEIIKGQHYNQSVDWWSFGILTYEMLIGQSPFNGTDEDELFWSVCNEEAYYPRFLSREAKSLLVLLLDKNPETRLGMPGCSAGDVCDQPFFRPIQWDKLERKEVEAPFKPKLKNMADVSNFDSDFTMEKPVLTPIDPQILASMDQEQFKGFTYTNPAMTD